MNDLVATEAISSQAGVAATATPEARWLRALVVRTAWLLLASITVGLFAVGLPGFIQRAATVCQVQPCQSQQLTPDRVHALAAAGLTPEAYAAWLALLGVADAAGFTAAAALLIWRRPGERMAQFAAFALLLFGGVTFPSFGRFVADAQPGLWPTHALLDVFGRAAFTALLFVFPDGRFVPRWTGWVALAWIAVQLPAPFLEGQVGTLPYTILRFLTDPAFVVGLATAAFGQVYRYRHVSTDAQRQQTRWIAVGFATALGVYLGIGLLSVALKGTDMSEPLPSLGLTTLANVAMAAIPISISVALLRNRLFEVDVLIGRALVYAALTACIIAIYMLVVGYLGSLFRTNENLLISLLATGAAAALFQPLRERLQQAVNRLLYGQRDEPYAVLSDLGRRLDTNVDPTRMLLVQPGVSEAGIDEIRHGVAFPGRST